MAQPPKTQIKGLMRFSYLSENGFAKSVDDLTAMREMLYDPARLDRRFRLFERLAFHTMALQDDTDFSCAVLIGDSFPDKARARLEDITRDFKPMQIVALPPMVHIQAVKAAYHALPDDPTATHVATFRQDDDDGMHRETTARIRAVGDAMLQVRPDDKPFIIAFNRGLYLDGAAKVPLSEWYERAPLGIGLAMVTAKGDHATVFRRNHRNLVEYYDCYTEIAKPMWIRSVHEDNDSSAMPQGRAGALRPRGIKRVLWDGFGLTSEMLEGL
ncbi:Rhamno transf domain containing protein [Sulfitobacter noctilucae]|uniref:glycosyltransferase n=1 Tax=Sulfitobacter noctilucae TaxID=1342302 RepID=UPI0004688F9B|nr:glycosyltransferase [Sulfitobacter noctilucae]KIN66463.1 Rhamno transf domain containing protein [Sulfitobacter noctilucae]